MKKLLLLFCLVTQTINAQTAGTGFIDLDGNHYETVIIGNQEWLATNLRVTKYKLSSLIIDLQYTPLGIANGYYDSNGSYRYFMQGNDATDIVNKGFLYSGYVAAGWNSSDDNDGWHIPTSAEWQQLLNTIGDNTGSLLTETNGTIPWNCTTTSENQYNFNLLPTGGVYATQNINGYYHYSSENYGDSALFWASDQFIAVGGFVFSFSLSCPMTGEAIISPVPGNTSNEGQNQKRSIRLVKNTPLSTNQFDKSDIKVYPNPTQNLLNVESQETIKSIEIFDLLGKQITIFKSARSIDISELQSGIYLLKINTVNQTFNSKIIKE